ncbi:hypothetical protein D3218_12910 [Aureimonas flava]|uniref:Uncharacterized protein n=1 Tax=Aureimonas flava TaxID=2320271 RepID=A0A3A1WHW5_9HYPH|nr:hypothetical protein [Aureimonas flava]RIY00183.1 hypothetical protein D3218_12910 [Aureimonas flava]
MREHTNPLATFGDLQNIVREAATVAGKMDWRADHAAIASRADVIRPYARDLITQFADTLARLGNTGVDVENIAAFQRIKDCLQDAFDDEFEPGWEEQAAKAEEAKREPAAWRDLEDEALWAKPAAAVAA